MQAPTGNIITQGQHGSTKAVDHSYYRDTNDDGIYAPENGVIDSYQQRGSGKLNAGNCLRMVGPSGLHQFAHCSRSLVSKGQRVVRGQKIAVMGDTGYAFGKHLHYWIQKPNGSYVYPPTLYKEAFINKPLPPPSSNPMPAIGSTIKVTISRTTFKPGTATPAGVLRPGTGGSYYIVRGYDPKYSGRIIVNSASAGGTVALALYYVNGNRIEGWS